MGQRENWDRLADIWERRVAAQAGDLDAYSVVAIDAVPLDDYWSVLDIGCGPGLTTIDLAERAGPNATVTGIDLSSRMISHAHTRLHAAAERGTVTPTNVDFRVADAETADLGTDHDLIFSRFGVMFFADPPAAFANFASALKPGGWLSFVAWGSTADNPWMSLPYAAAARVLDVAVDATDPAGPGPFAFGDPDATRQLLTTAGFEVNDVIDITQPRRIVHGTERVWADTTIQLGPSAKAYAEATPDQRDACVDAVVADLAPYRQPGPTGDWLLPAHARAYVARTPGA